MARSDRRHLSGRGCILLRQEPYRYRADVFPYPSEPEGKTGGREHPDSLSGKIAPFSWMRYIVVSEKDLQADCTPILAHELAHIRLRHSWDILIAQACIIVQWFNPAAWLVKQELQAVHEYEADSEVLRQGVNAKEYQLLLIKKPLAQGSTLSPTA